MPRTIEADEVELRQLFSRIEQYRYEKRYMNQ